MSNISVDLDVLGKSAYQLYCGLINGGFTQGHALGLVSQFCTHCYMQQKLQDHAEFKKLVQG